MRIRIAGAVAVLAFVSSPVSAQVAWESPFLLSPQTPSGLGIMLIDPSHGDGIGVLGTWRANPAAEQGIGFRAGVAEDGGDDIAVFGGIDLTGPLVRATDHFPADVIWMFGAGIGVGDDVLLSVPAGLSLGTALEADGVVFSPYVAPRVVLDGILGDNDRGNGPRNGDYDGDDLNVNFAVDIGMDLEFSRDWIVRFAWSLGDHDALGIGLVFPGLN